MVTKKTKIFLGISIIFFLLSVGGVYMIWNNIQNKGVDLAQKANALANFEAQNQSYRELEKLVEETGSERDKLQQYLLTEDKTIDFLSMIEELATTQSVKLSTDALKVQNIDGPFDSLLISYRVEGMKTRVDVLLKLLETLPYQSVVSGISLQYTSKEGADITTGTFTLAVTLVNYDT